MAIVGFKTVLSSEIDSNNTEVGDLLITGKGDVGVNTDDDNDAKKRSAVEGIKSRISLLKGNYFLNLREGIPYFGVILKKNPNIPLIKSIMLQTIQSYPTVISVPRLDTDFDRQARSLSLTFTAQIDPGIELLSENFGDLVLDLDLQNTGN